MFLDDSRYAKVAQDDLSTDDGSVRKAIRLRRLPATKGESYAVKDNDALDVLANQYYSDGTRFWHIADANTELQADDLLEQTGRFILLPKS